MPFSGMLSHVALVRIDVSEERSTSIIRMTRISELGMMKHQFLEEPHGVNIPEDGIVHSQCHENLES
jgi:hypothetical protein